MKYAVLVAVAACRSAPDLSRPIDVVPEGSWSSAQRADLEHAAACWNAGFGVDYRPGATSDSQRVTVTFDEVQCLSVNAWAFTTTSFEDRVSICPYYFTPPGPSYPGSLFGVLTHELGHVAGIPVTVDDTTSIMGGVEALSLSGRIDKPIFSSTDHALFREYNPDFIEMPACDPVVAITGGEYQCACPAR